jgi:signal transduction histidine kinase/ActR/RegA family two-component response regulator
MKSGLRSRQSLAVGLLLGAFAAGVWYVVNWCVPHAHGGFAGLWPASGFLAAALFSLRGKKAWPLAAVAALAAAGELSLLLGSGLALKSALFHSQWDVTEAVLAAILARRFLGTRRLLRSPGGFLRLQLLAIFPACLVASLGFLLEQRLFGPGEYFSLQGRMLAHLLGMGAVFPAVLLLAQPSLPALKRSRRETAAILGGVAVVVAFMLNQSAPPAVVITPTLLFAAFRLGPRGAAVSTMMISLLALPAVVLGNGPFIHFPTWNLDQRVAVYQATVLSLLFGVTLVSFMLAQQARLTQLLGLRATIARSARQRAIQASQAKTEFLATMSHEVRTPMNSILGVAAVLGGDPGLSPAARSKVDLIGKAGASLMSLLNDILDFSKVEAGQIELEDEDVDLAVICSEMVELIAPTAEAKGLEVAFTADPAAAGLFRGDALRLRQILFNLLNNAVKFTARGRISLSVAVRHDGSQLVTRFEVADTGIGIEPEQIGRLFVRFSQADSSVSRTYGGTGLGLAICKGLVERMGGQIGVDSQPGAGSVFWFEAPLRPVGETDLQQRADAAMEYAPLGARVLLVDDHPVNRQLGQALLEMLGCRVDLAEGGQEAVAAVGKGGYDIILMDVHMPVMDGLAATRAIRQMEGAVGATPIIALSADVLPQNIALCLKAGMVDHVPKPVQLDVLYAVLHRQLNPPAADAAGAVSAA